ncbi:unnamed protein product, partial [Ectocarpus sp. 12 AP-2014]
AAVPPLPEAAALLWPVGEARTAVGTATIRADPAPPRRPPPPPTSRRRGLTNDVAERVSGGCARSAPLYFVPTDEQGCDRSRRPKRATRAGHEARGGALLPSKLRGQTLCCAYLPVYGGLFAWVACLPRDRWIRCPREVVNFRPRVLRVVSFCGNGYFCSGVVDGLVREILRRWRELGWP